MNTYQRLHHIQQQRQTRLCIGLDLHPHLLPNPTGNNAEYFLKRIIEVTAPFTCAYKFNLAYFEAMGSNGFHLLESILEFCSHLSPSPILIADAKRSDVPHTAERYAQAYFQHYNFDAITLNPLLGRDSVQPFLNFTDKLIFLLILTSNTGASDFLLHRITSAQHCFQYIAEHSAQWGKAEQIGFVVGATQPDHFSHLRQQYPHHYFLIPGIGAQGGSIAEIRASNRGLPALFTVSRSILYASEGQDFAYFAQQRAQQFQQQSWMSGSEAPGNP